MDKELSQAVAEGDIDTEVQNIMSASIQSVTTTSDIEDALRAALIKPLILVTVNDFGTAINRTEIETALTENGVTLPLTQDVVFNICDSSETMFEITYRQALDNFYNVKLGAA